MRAAIEPLAKPIVNTLGTVGLIFMNGSTNEHGKLIEQFQEGAPMLLLESTGGMTQAFAYVMKAVRMMRPRWDIDFVLRLVTEYKVRASCLSSRWMSKAKLSDFSCCQRASRCRRSTALRIRCRRRPGQ